MSAAAFIFIAIFTLSGALAAACLRKLIHAALCLVAAFLGLALSYFLLGAEFVGLVQVFVYVGAVAVLVVYFALSRFLRTNKNLATRTYRFAE